MSAYDELAARWQRVMMPNYGTPPVALVQGKGCRVWDADGKDYLDLLAGIAVSSLGHAHPAVVDAVSHQVATLAHTSNLYLHEPGLRLAERLTGLLDTAAEARVFFCSTGTEANEAALKLVLRHGSTIGRRRIVAADHGFHGRTLGALSLTGKASIREPFGPYGTDVVFVPYGDAQALAAAVDEHTVAVLLETTQGEAGVVPPPEGYLVAAREICDATGTLLWLDEVQSAIGRTGYWYAHQADGVLPDMLTLAKGLGGGLPIGACIGIGPAATAFQRGDHGSTFGGNLVSVSAALAVLDTIEADGLLDHVREVGATFAAGLAAVEHPLLAGVRGRGLWLALVLTDDVSAVVEQYARAAGFLVNAVAPDAIRLAPPLVITAQECREFVDALPGVLAGAQQQLDTARVGP
ncbi:acetylornithine transaminase [Acidothermaceae bacterium B102]|nr:acetylornithine transaminase [Acidothermaceae bacterium B102]